MKISIENITGSIRLEGRPDLQRLSELLPNTNYQGSFFNGLKFEMKDPECSVFVLGDGTIKFSGLKQEGELEKAARALLSTDAFRSSDLKAGPDVKIEEVIASHDMGSPLDARSVYEEFKEEGIVYDPTELPGFILRLGRSGIEVLIFPEGKLIVKGAPSVAEAVTSLHMIGTRLGKA